MSEPRTELRFAADRVGAILDALERIASGELRTLLPISPLHDELDAIAYGVNTLTDELRLSKDALAHASESKSVFVRTASHEIRTPIAVVLILAELLARPDVSNDERAELVQQLRATSQSVLSLVGNLLDLSKLESGRPTLTIGPVSPLELVREIVLSLEPQALRKALTVRVDTRDKLPARIATDELRLRQILVNVIGNALKFTDSGGVLITIAHDRSPTGAVLRVDIQDSGVGIPDHRHDKLFEPFEQGDVSMPRLHGGSGLGLAISRHLAEQLGGALVLVESRAGQGSTFRLTIQAPPIDRTAEISGVAPPLVEKTALPLQGVRILLADDSVDLQVAARRLLRSMGATVDCANNGREATTMALAERYDVILMDLIMPEVDGIQAVRALRERGSDCPIIALTADATTTRRQQAAEAGCSAVLSKPFDSQHLIASIDQLLRQPQGVPVPSRLKGRQQAASD